MDILKSNIVVGVTAALAVTVLAPVLVPALAAAGRPLAKSLLKGGMMLYEKGREAVAAAGESVEDMVAEIRAEEAMPRAAGEPVHEHGAAPPRPGAAGMEGAPAAGGGAQAPASAGTQAAHPGIAAV